MPAVLLLITVGAIMVYSAVEGVTITDAIKGVKGNPLDPKGGFTGSFVGGIGGGDFGAGEPASAAALVAEADRMIACDQPYVWGGGHASFSENGPWDCSGAMSQLMHHLGLLTSAGPIISTGFMSEGQAGRGQVFTIYANPVHVFLIMETGTHKGQAWGTTSRSKSAGGSLKWHTHTTAGFVARHYAGM